MSSITEFALLKGPEDEDLEALGKYGYDPDAAHRVTENIRDRERSLAGMLASDPASPSHLQDVVRAHAFYWDLNELLPNALLELGVDRNELLSGGKERLNRILDEIPTLVVESAVRYGVFRMGSKVWETNDIYDLSHAGVAVPYCDIVALDRNTVAQLRKAKMEERFGCKLANTPGEILYSM